jgi:hypothetical protein
MIVTPASTTVLPGWVSSHCHPAGGRSTTRAGCIRKHVPREQNWRLFTRRCGSRDHDIPLLNDVRQYFLPLIEILAQFLA